MLTALLLLLAQFPFPFPLPPPDELPPPREAKPAPVWYPLLRWPLTIWYLGDEVLDPREVPYFLADANAFGKDMRILADRAHELAGAPHLADCLRLPSREAGNAACSLNRANWQYLYERDMVYPGRWQLTRALEESNRLYQVWDAVRDAQADWYYVSTRRLTLARLRRLLGDEPYYRGDWPCPIP